MAPDYNRDPCRLRTAIRTSEVLNWSRRPESSTNLKLQSGNEPRSPTPFPSRSTGYHFVLESESSDLSDEGSESVHSVQNRETDCAKDTSDTDWTSSVDSDSFSTEFEVATDDEQQSFVDSHNSSSGEEEVFTAAVSEIYFSDVEVVFADSEDSMSSSSTSPEIGMRDYWKCARCQSTNNNPMFRYCERCFRVRKDFFPPRPKRSRKKRGGKSDVNKNENAMSHLQTYISSQCKGTLLLDKDECDAIEPKIRLDFKDIKVPAMVDSDAECEKSINVKSNDEGFVSDRAPKRGHDDHSDNDLVVKKCKLELREPDDDDENVNNCKELTVSESYEKQSFLKVDLNVHDDVSFSQPMFPNIELMKPMVKSLSDPGVKVSKDDIDLHKLQRKPMSNSDDDLSLRKSSKKKKDDSKSNSDSDMCITCLVEPKSGVFVHGRIAHICCCYKCSIEVWVQTKRCPICNCRVSNVLRAFVV